MTPPTGRSAPDACSVMWDGAGDATAYGTAAPATFWVGLEQPGPWGRAALTQSRLPTEVGTRLGTACTTRGGRLALLRAPGEHPAPAHVEAPRQVYVAWAGRADGPPAFLLGARVARRPTSTRSTSTPSRAATRPRCGRRCPRSGRSGRCCSSAPTAAATSAARCVADRRAGRPRGAAGAGVGVLAHRRAPVLPHGVLLPWGRTLARLTPADVTAALDAADSGRLATSLLGPWHDRGTSALSPQAQVAESAVRAELLDDDPGSLGAVLVGERLAEVTHRDGRRWRVALHVEQGPAKRNSCGDAALVARTWTADVTPV